MTAECAAQPDRILEGDTSIGSISNPDGLTKALGSGNVKVSFSLE